MSGLKSIYAQKLDSIQYLSETVVTAQYAPTSTAKSIYKTKIIGLAEIKARAANNLNDILKYELNFSTTSDAVLGGNTKVQGIGGENVKILIDGVPISGRQNGQVDLSQIFLGNVERIEIVEGAQSVNYGSNAIGGIINIITKKTNLKPFGVQLNSYYESLGQYNVDALVNTNFKQKHFLTISGGRYYFDGFNPKGNNSRDFLWNPKTQIFANSNYQYNYKKNTFNVRSQNSKDVLMDRGPARSPLFNTAFDDVFTSTRSNSAFDFNRKINNKSVLNSNVGVSTYERNRSTLFRNLDTKEAQKVNNDSISDIYTGSNYRLTYSFPIIESTVIQVGTDGNYETAQGEKIKGNTKEIFDYSGFAGLEYGIKELQIKPGVRINQNSLYGGAILWALNMKYNLTDRFSLRASASDGYRTPNLRELYFNFKDINHDIAGNTNLNPEKSTHFNIALNYLKTIGKYIYKTESSFFVNDIRNLIALTQTEPLKFQYNNIGNYRNFGYQFGNEIIRENLRIQTALSIVGSTSDLNTKAVYHPAATVGLTYRFEKIRTEFSSFYKYEGLSPYFARNNGFIEQGTVLDYNLLDANLGYSCFKNTVKIKAGVKNIFNVTQANLAGNIQSGGHAGASANLVSTGTTIFTSIGYTF